MPGTPFELKNTLVRAGAGAGKTRGLVDTVVEVFRRFQGESNPRIVLTTFTRKATQELKERLILRACADKDAELLQFVSDPAKLQISTIHGLLNIFLKQVGHLAGLDSGFQIISEEEGRFLARLALREVLVADQDALTWTETYGFERTLEMCRQYHRQKEEHGALQPATELELKNLVDVKQNYWKRALLALAEEVQSATDDRAWQAYGSALSAFASSFAFEASAAENLPTKPRRSAKQAELEFLHEQVQATLKLFKDEIERPGFTRAFWPEMTETWLRFENLGARFSKELDDLKRVQGRYEMVDLELKAISILRDQPFLGAVFSESWDFWMIDEYQDTSPLQVAVLQALIGDRPKYIVGDPQQSIYLFRGAEVGVFHEAEREIGQAGGVIKVLDKNYRSEPELLLFMNDFMQPLGASFMRMEPRMAVEAPPIKPTAVLIRAADDEAENAALAARIEELLATGATLDEICILGRTHRNLMDIARALKNLGYPTHVHASRGFQARREVMDALALWRFMINPHDNLTLMILLRSPWFFTEDRHLTEWMKSKPLSLWRKLSALDNPPEMILRLKQNLLIGSEQGVVRGFEAALRANGLLDLSLKDDSAGRKESNLWKLIFKARQLEKDGGQSLLELASGDAVDALDSNEGDATSAQEPNSINLMTIHGSKGLEFDHVLLARMGESPKPPTTAPFAVSHTAFHFPIWLESEGRGGEFVASPLDIEFLAQRRERELSEFDRWLYVALTRAKKSLTLTWSGLGRDSWASRHPWFLQPAGLTQKPGYVFEIREECAAPTLYKNPTKAEGGLREPFQILTSAMVPSRRSVSDLLNVTPDFRRTFAGEDVLNRWQAQLLGTRIHRALEALRFGQYELSESNSDPLVEAAVDYVLNLQEPPLTEWIAKGHPEWGFQVKTARGVVEGQIDLWGKHEQKLYVVDYKSGSTRQKDAAFRQLSLYAWALRRFGHREPCSMVVVYPLAQKCEVREFGEDLFNNWEREFSAP